VRVHLSQGINEVEIRSAKGILLKQLTTTRAAAADTAAVTIEAENASARAPPRSSPTPTAPAATPRRLKGLGYVGNGAANTFEVPRGPGFDKPATTTSRSATPTPSWRRPRLQPAGHRPAAGGHRDRRRHRARLLPLHVRWNSFLERTIPVTLTTAGGSLVFGNPTAYAPRRS
jgi:hypothetical protein